MIGAAQTRLPMLRVLVTLIVVAAALLAISTHTSASISEQLGQELVAAVTFGNPAGDAVYFQRAHAAADAKTIATAIQSAIDAFVVSRKLFDDMTYVVIKVTERA